MRHSENSSKINHFTEELSNRKSVIAEELVSRSFWFVKLRWWVPPVLALGGIAGWGAGIESGKNVLPAALLILLFNIFLWNVGKRLLPSINKKEMLSSVDSAKKLSTISNFAYLQVVLDFTAIFYLIHLTGGAASPFIFFFIFHIIFASILLRPRAAFTFATIAAIGMPLLAMLEYKGVLIHHYLVINKTHIDLSDRPTHVAVELFFFGVSIFVTAFFTTAVMRMLNRRILDLSDLMDTVSEMNKRFESLFVMTQAILTSKELPSSLDTMASQISEAMDMEGVSIKLFKENGRDLYYAATHGLPSSVLEQKDADLNSGALTKRILDGKESAAGLVGVGVLQHDVSLEKSGFKSVLFLPIKMEGRLTGVLCSYSKKEQQIPEDEMYFFYLAADIIGIAIDNAKSFQEASTLAEERAWFMVQVAHNLRAPLAAVSSILDVVSEGYVGSLNNEQLGYMERISYRVDMMKKMVDELVTLAKSRIGKQLPQFAKTDIAAIAKKTFNLFEQQAVLKQIDFTLSIPENISPIDADEKMIEQIFDNLLSNAIKYTKPGGTIKLSVVMEGSDKVKIVVADTGIGVSESEKKSLFTDFFRASNAKELHEIGSGLGLSITKKFVELHGGRIVITSSQNRGSVFEITILTGQPSM